MDGKREETKGREGVCVGESVGWNHIASVDKGGGRDLVVR